MASKRCCCCRAAAASSTVHLLLALCTLARQPHLTRAAVEGKQRVEVEDEELKAGVPLLSLPCEVLRVLRSCRRRGLAHV